MDWTNYRRHFYIVECVAVHRTNTHDNVSRVCHPNATHNDSNLLRWFCLSAEFFGRQASRQAASWFPATNPKRIRRRLSMGRFYWFYTDAKSAHDCMVTSFLVIIPALDLHSINWAVCRIMTVPPSTAIQSRRNQIRCINKRSPGPALKSTLYPIVRWHQSFHQYIQYPITIEFAVIQ